MERPEFTVLFVVAVPFGIVATGSVRICANLIISMFYFICFICFSYAESIGGLKTGDVLLYNIF